jgi:hypothetical protein
MNQHDPWAEQQDARPHSSTLSFLASIAIVDQQTSVAFSAAETLLFAAMTIERLKGYDRSPEFCRDRAVSYLDEIIQQVAKGNMSYRYTREST